MVRPVADVTTGNQQGDISMKHFRARGAIGHALNKKDKPNKKLKEYMKRLNSGIDLRQGQHNVNLQREKDGD